jgi:hypothetical protein
VDGAGELADGTDTVDGPPADGAVEGRAGEADGVAESPIERGVASASAADDAVDGSTDELDEVDATAAGGVDGLADDWDSSDRIASRAAPQTSAFMTIPGPPPKGVSSTV